MRNKKLFVDIHAIQTVPPSNINRDDTGRPKTAQYGGVTRARVSSQSWKKAMREYFKENFDVELGKRTLNVVDYIASFIRKLDSTINEEEALELSNKVLNLGKIKTDKNKAKALFFVSPKQAERLAEIAVNGLEDNKKVKDEIKEALVSNPTIDIALFGRMVADDPSLNEDASSQVAHSISTHRVDIEFDYYTAMDDLSPVDNAGAGMLGTIEFDSSTLYRYANVAIHELRKQLYENNEDTVNAVSAFIEAFVNSMPTGKVNTFANQTLPEAVIVIIRKDRPVNLVTAFESPIKSTLGYVDKSIEKLSQECNRVQKYVDKPEHSFAIGVENVGQECKSLETMLGEIKNCLMKILE